jgi:hypothetical protein
MAKLGLPRTFAVALQAAGGLGPHQGIAHCVPTRLPVLGGLQSGLVVGIIDG